MANLLKDFDLEAPDVDTRMLERVKELEVKRKEAYDALIAVIPEDARPLVWALVDIGNERDALNGARALLKKAQGLINAAKNGAVFAGQGKHRKLPRGTTRPDPHFTVTPAPAPTTRPSWDYKPVEARPQQRGEVITSSPFGVEVVARQVEEFVRRMGKCSKPDVSAAFPDARPYLTAAYDHLHASRRVHVNGWTLTPWPEQRRAVP